MLYSSTFVPRCIVRFNPPYDLSASTLAKPQRSKYITSRRAYSVSCTCSSRTTTDPHELPGTAQSKSTIAAPMTMVDRLSVVCQPVEFDDDDWHSVKDVKKRKQIQDRLAQRARRKCHSSASYTNKLLDISRRTREASPSGLLAAKSKHNTSDELSRLALHTTAPGRHLSRHIGTSMLTDFAII